MVQCFLFRFALAFSFGDLLQKDLDDFVNDWNSHLIRKNKHVYQYMDVLMTSVKCHSYMDSTVYIYMAC